MVLAGEPQRHVPCSDSRIAMWAPAKHCRRPASLRDVFEQHLTRRSTVMEPCVNAS
jgi:hypothetical protein